MIKASEVMLIDSNGQKQGIVNIVDALEAANKESLDLVQVSSLDSEPVVCKLLDYGKHLFDKKRIFHPRSEPKKILQKKLNFGPQQMLVTIILN